MTKDLSPRQRIIFPLDFPALNEALRYAVLLKDHVGVFKIGLELFISSGPESVKAVKEETGLPVFLDLKLHDIPETVKRALSSALSLGADFLTVHADGIGPLKGAFLDARKKGLKVLGVTALTSLNEDDLRAGGVAEAFLDPIGLVMLRAGLAHSSGCSGVVCSGREVSAVKNKFGSDFLAICPGIRGEEDRADDQKRTTTAYEAVVSGADYIVVGRPIKNSPDPQRSASFISFQIDNALKKKGE
jgi:orotidine-5'-phosphate decarboxylase